MKPIAIALSLVASLISSNAIAGLFGPTNYDECILENMKGVTNESASRLVAQSCRSKFEDKKKKPIAGICKIYWDGFKFQIGDKPNDNYIRYSMDRDGIELLHLSLPKKLAERLEIDKEADPTKGKWGEFFQKNEPQIRTMCGFN